VTSVSGRPAGGTQDIAALQALQARIAALAAEVSTTTRTSHYGSCAMSGTGYRLDRALRLQVQGSPERDLARAGLDEGRLPLSPSNLLYIENPCIYKKFQ
jgi:hypothetical protein